MENKFVFYAYEKKNSLKKEISQFVQLATSSRVVYLFSEYLIWGIEWRKIVIKQIKKHEHFAVYLLHMQLKMEQINQKTRKFTVKIQRCDGIHSHSTQVKLIDLHFII